MDQIQVRTIIKTFFIALFVGLMAAIASPLIETEPGVRESIGAALMGFFCTLIVLFIEGQIKTKLLAKLPLLITIFISFILELVCMIAIMFVVVFLMGMNQDGISLHEMLERTDFLVGLISMAGLILGVQFVIAFQSILGRGVLSRLLLGTYRVPREVCQFYMFLDLRGSTGIAEKLGHLQFLAFLNEFYRDMDQVVHFNQGDIHKYAGDGAVLSWRLKKSLQQQNPVNFFFQLQGRITRKTAYYQKRFGFVPQFKAGLHFGTAVIAEMGHGKKEIALIGDAMNTAARLEQTCKVAGCDFLISESALQKLQISSKVRINQKYRARLRGKDEVIRFFSLEFDGMA